MPDQWDGEPRLAHRMQRDAGAGLALALQQAGAGEILQGAVDGGTGRAELGRQRFLAGNGRAGRPLARDNAAGEFLADIEP
jgi:hypothetical protein